MYIILIFLLIYILFMSLILPKSKLFSNSFLLIIMFFLTVMIGFRYDVGLDYMNYFEKFKYYWNDFDNDPLFTALNYLVHYLDGEFYWVMLISIFLTNLFITLYLWDLKWNSNMIAIAMLIYISSNIFLYTNGVRQGIAVSIILYGSRYIKTKELKKFLFWVIAASLFHFSAIFMIILYFIKFKIDIVKYILLILISYLLVWTGWINELLVFVVQYIPKYNFYIETNLLDFNNEVNIIALGVILKVFISILLVALYDSKKHDLIITFYQLGIIMNILSLATFMIGRIGYYFYIFDMIAIPFILYNLKNKIYFKYILILVVIAYLSILVKMLIISPAEGNLIYKWYFNFN